MDRSNHYEAAFEAYLRAKQLAYVAVDETRRNQLDNEPLKNLDFIVHARNGTRLLVDVKGRRFPAGSRDAPRRVWESWSTRDDIEGLLRWEKIQGAGSVGLLVFMYRLMPQVILPAGTPDLWTWRDRIYLLRAIGVHEYLEHMKPRSSSWRTVFLATEIFRTLVKPLSHWTEPQAADPTPSLFDECTRPSLQS